MHARLTFFILHGVLLGIVLTGCRPAGPPPPLADGSGMDHGSMPSMTRLHQARGVEFDAAFASEMIEHHLGAVEMSEDALKSARRAEVQRAARRIIADQKREIDQMGDWVKDWTGNAPDPELRELMKKDMAPMMTAFKTECAHDCDRAFLVHMKTHHQMAVEMAEMAEDRAEHPELKKLATAIIAAQSREIAQFDTWLTEWYP